MAPAASATSHGTGATNTMSGYNKTAAAPAGYNNVYEALGSSSVTGSNNEYGSSSKVGVSAQQTSQAQGKTNSSDLAAMYSSKSTLNKVSVSILKNIINVHYTIKIKTIFIFSLMKNNSSHFNHRRHFL